MLKSELLRAIQQEIQRHDFSHFIENPPSVAQGGKGVVVPGCPMCKKRINTMPQFRDASVAGSIVGYPKSSGVTGLQRMPSASATAHIESPGT